jgi:hypothetical protein
MEVTVQVSLGELVDKYTILEIKLEKLSSEEAKENVRLEMAVLNEVYQSLDPILHYYARLLKMINEEIWMMQDEIRENPDPQKCVEIIKHNDRRFRVKNKINQRSRLKEQKGYPKKKVIFFGHAEAGDTLTNVGIVRYLSTLYDEVEVVMRPQFEDLAKRLYQDDSSIKIRVDPHHSSYKGVISHDFYDRFKNDFTDVVAVYLLNPHHRQENIHVHKDFYNEFYLEANINPACRFTYMYLPRDSEKEILPPKEKYIFVHEKIPGQITNKIHTSYEIVKPLESTLLLDYCSLLEQAEEIYVDDSAFFCLCCYLDLSKVSKLQVYHRGGYSIKEYPLVNQQWEVMTM